MRGQGGPAGRRRRRHNGYVEREQAGVDEMLALLVAPDWVGVQVLSWSMELSRALCFLHNCNPVIIHRDLKPANLLLNEDGHLKVAPTPQPEPDRRHDKAAAGEGREDG